MLDIYFIAIYNLVIGARCADRRKLGIMEFNDLVSEHLDVENIELSEMSDNRKYSSAACCDNCGEYQSLDIDLPICRECKDDGWFHCDWCDELATIRHVVFDINKPVCVLCVRCAGLIHDVKQAKPRVRAEIERLVKCE